MTSDADDPAMSADKPSASPPPEKAVNASEAAHSDEHETVYGPMEDELFGKRIFKSFGSRGFWGTVVTAYVVGKGVFYKVSFDDGDVDILSADEVQHDLVAAKRHVDEDAPTEKTDRARSPTDTTSTSPTVSPYVDALRSKKSSLKRQRDSTDASNQEHVAGSTWQVKLWSMRLFATIMEEDGYIRLQDFVPMPNGEPGEMESSGIVKPGDALLAVQGRVVHGVMDHMKACELIRTLPRPLTLTFIRPPRSADPVGKSVVEAAVKNIFATAPGVLISRAVEESATKKARTDQSSPSLSSRPLTAPVQSDTDRPTTPPIQASSLEIPAVRLRPPTPDVQLVGVQPSSSTVDPLSEVSTPAPVMQPPPAFSKSPTPPMDTLSFATPEEISVASEEARVPTPDYSLPHQRASRTPSPAPEAPRQDLQKPSNGTLREPPRQESAQASGQLRSVYFPVRGTQAPGTSLLPTTRPVLSQFARSLPPSHQGQPTHHPEHAPMNMSRTVPSATAFNGTNSTPNHNPVFLGSQGIRRFQHPGLTSSAHHNQIASQREHFNPPMQNNGPPMPVFVRAPPTHGNSAQAQRYAYSYQAYGSMPSGAPSRQTQMHSTVSSFQRISPRLAEQSSSEDERARGMTLGDYMTYTAQQERLALRAAARQRTLNSEYVTRPVQSVPSRIAQEGTLAAETSFRGPPLRPAAAQTEARAERSSFDDFDSSVADVGRDETSASLLSLDDLSFLDDIPVNSKQRASRFKKKISASPSTATTISSSQSRPSYLDKYEADGVVEVTITQPRLYITLSPMGQYVSISSFVRGDGGEIGEIEASGKVLTGDILVGVGQVEIPTNISADQVARIVSSQPRPYAAYFIRATWEMLE